MKSLLTKFSPAIRLRTAVELFGTDIGALKTVSMPQYATTLLAEAYDNLPTLDTMALSNYRALREETMRLFELLTVMCNVNVVVVIDDPYKTVRSMLEEVEQNNTLRVWSTKSCGNPHGFFTNDENDMFRAVHDAFGHCATGSTFSVNGEEAAFRAQAPMYSPQARRALVTELRGQSAHFFEKGYHAPQKVAVMNRTCRRPVFPPLEDY